MFFKYGYIECNWARRGPIFWRECTLGVYVHLHLLLLKFGFSTKLHLHCLHLNRLCGLCHHPPLSNSGNVSGHHLAGSLVTKPAAGHPSSVWSRAFHQSNFAILAICPHTLACMRTNPPSLPLPKCSLPTSNKR